MIPRIPTRSNRIALLPIIAAGAVAIGMLVGLMVGV